MRDRKTLLAFVVVLFAVSTVARAGVSSNDQCSGAIPIAIGGTASGSTVGETFDNVGTCGTSNTAPGVWYSVTGDGTTLTASTCELSGNPTGSANYDSKISVFCADCGTPTCVTGNDDFPGCSFHASVSWCSQAGATYRILVHGFSTTTGSFTLAISSNSVACVATVACPAGSTGACCNYGELSNPSLSCSETDAASCDDGVFQGEGSSCTSPTFQALTATSCPDQDYFSTTTSHYAVSTLVEQQAAYSVSIFGPPIVLFAKPVTPYQGLDALDVLADGTLIFSPFLTPAINPSGLRHENAYHWDPTTQASTLVVDGRGLGLRSLDAIDKLRDGSFAFSTATDQPFGVGTLYDENVYRLVPPSTITLLFDGRSIGLISLDAVDVLADDSVAFSTASGQFLTLANGVVFLQDRNAYVWSPSSPGSGFGPSASGTVSLAFDGLGIGIVNLDAISLARGIEPLLPHP